MSRGCLVCAPRPFATTSRSGFFHRRSERTANVVTMTVCFFVWRWCSALERRGSPWMKYASSFSGFPPGTRPPKRWHQLSQRKIAELRGRITRLKAMETLLKRVEDCRCDALDECGERILRQSVLNLENYRATGRVPGNRVSDKKV